MLTYEPGTVAVATVRGVPNVLVFRIDASEAMGQRSYMWVSVGRVDCRHTHNGEQVTDVRPLVTLDMSAYPFLMDALRGRPVDDSIDALIADIEAQTRPPKPAEPTGLGAVVEDAQGERWVRAGLSHEGRLLDNWRLTSGDGVGDWQPWDRIAAVRVLSEGVPA